MDKHSLRWGILGAANIARKNWKAIWNSRNGRVVALASRDLDRSSQFISACMTQVPFEPAPRAMGSYEELLAAADVDAVYIPLPTGVRSKWVKRAAEAGKHVLCEKPCAASVGELREMIEVCRRHKVQFMDGVMFMQSSRLQRMREVLDDADTIGRIRRIASAFTFYAPDEFFASNIRGRADLEPYGCLGDLGWYCIRFALWATNWNPPSRVTGQMLSSYKHPNGNRAVPVEFSGELFFADGVSSSFYCSFLSETEQWATVGGERGYLRLADFVLPFSGNQIGFEIGKPSFEVRGCDFEMRPQIRRIEINEASHSDPTAQESQMFRRFAEAVQSGTLNQLWPEIALKTQLVMEKCYESAFQQGKPLEL